MKIYYHWMLGKKKAEVDELDDQEFRDNNKEGDVVKEAIQNKKNLRPDAPYVRLKPVKNKKGLKISF